MLIQNPGIINSDWVFQFVKDVFESLEKSEAEQSCIEQYRRLFIDYDMNIDTKSKHGAQIHEKLMQWLLKEGIEIVKKSTAKDVGAKAMLVWGVSLKLMGQVWQFLVRFIIVLFLAGFAFQREDKQMCFRFPELHSLK